MPAFSFLTFCCTSFKSFSCVFKVDFLSFQETWLPGWKHFSQTPTEHYQRVDWYDLFRSPHIGYMYVFWNRGAQMKYFVWLRRFMHEQKPPGSSHSIRPAPDVTTTPWPSSLLTSHSAFSHRHNDALLMVSEPTLIQLLPPYLIETKPLSNVFLLSLFKINLSLLFYWYNKGNKRKACSRIKINC